MNISYTEPLIILTIQIGIFKFVRNYVIKNEQRNYSRRARGNSRTKVVPELLVGVNVQVAEVINYLLNVAHYAHL